jgi:prepilin-type processing-associated H-X9-DG protein
MNMDENLAGYLLNGLDEKTRKEVETYLASDPKAQHKLELMRRALEPLSADQESPVPSGDLVIRTLAVVAEHCSRGLPRAPVVRETGRGRSLWRRADALAAAVILFTVLGLVLPALPGLRAQTEPLTACKNNLRIFFSSLRAFHDQHGHYPDVNAEAPHNVAGMVVPLLIKAGTLPADINVRCPGNGPPRPCPATLDELRAMSQDEFKQYAPHLAACYAYSLGHRDKTGYHPPHINLGMGTNVPLMGDYPPADGDLGNSPNHGRLGQNILFQDGHVAFITSRQLGDDDDIFLNRSLKEAAGEGIGDYVLGQSAARP